LANGAQPENLAEYEPAEEKAVRLLAEIESERATLAAIMASMSDGLLLIDASHRIRYANARLRELAGTDPDTLIGLHVDEAFAAVRERLADPAAAWSAWTQALTSGRERSSFEVSLLTPRRRDLFVECFQVTGFAGMGLGLGILLRDVTDSKLLTRLEERERIAMDLHDGVIQSLYGVTLGLAARERLLQGDTSETREALRQARAQINAVVHQIRNYIFNLRPAELDGRGLRAGLETLAEELRINTLIRPTLEVDPEADRSLSHEAVTSVLHVARESTANVIRHAGASAVRIRLTQDDAQVVLTIDDNGRGFDRQGEPRGNACSVTPDTAGTAAGSTTSGGGAAAGQGLRNMAERARMLGGNLVVRSEPGRGTEVRLAVPRRQSTGDE
jgi:PAS domain S-box-containing protein